MVCMDIKSDNRTRHRFCQPSFDKFRAYIQSIKKRKDQKGDRIVLESEKNDMFGSYYGKPKTVFK